MYMPSTIMHASTSVKVSACSSLVPSSNHSWLCALSQLARNFCRHTKATMHNSLTVKLQHLTNIEQCWQRLTDRFSITVARTDAGGCAIIGLFYGCNIANH